MYTILSNGLVRVNLTGCYITMSEYKRTNCKRIKLNQERTNKSVLYCFTNKLLNYEFSRITRS